MEYLDILNEKGEKTGIIKERTAVHTDGDLHGTSHVWIARISPETGKTQVLLQKRSKNKDSFPGCLDTSSAGHMEAGGTFSESAVRELEEELGLKVTEDELEYLFRIRVHKEGFFYGKNFIENRISNVYLLKRSIDENDLTLQTEEIESVVWMDCDFVMKKLSEKDKGYCIEPEEFSKLCEILENKPSLIPR